MGFELPKKEAWSYGDFKEHIIDADKNLPPFKESMPQRIETGLIGQSLNDLVDYTNSTGLEAMRVVKRSFNDTLLVQKDFSSGTKSSVRPRFKINQIRDRVDGRYNRDESTPVIMHTHPRGSPANGKDLSKLVIDQGSFEAQVASMIGSSSGNMLIFRTFETPEIPEENIDTWTNEIYEAVQRRANELSFAGGNFLEAEYKAKLESLRDICDEYNLVAYTSAPGSTEYSLAHL